MTDEELKAKKAELSRLRKEKAKMEIDKRLQAERDAIAELSMTDDQRAERDRQKEEEEIKKREAKAAELLRRKEEALAAAEEEIRKKKEQAKEEGKVNSAGYIVIIVICVLSSISILFGCTKKNVYDIPIYNKKLDQVELLNFMTPLDDQIMLRNKK